MLARASTRGVSKKAIASALTSAANPADAVARLAALGLVAPGAYAALGEDAPVLFETPLRRLWLEVSSEAESAFLMDRSWAVPALKVESAGVTYFVHGVVHGQLRPANRGAVLSVVKAAQKSGAALYSEQNLPAFYGYSYGRETLDHDSGNGTPAEVVATRGSPWVSRLSDAVTLLGGGAASVRLIQAVIETPANPLLWLGLLALLAVLWVYATSKLPLLRMLERGRAQRLRRDGLHELADLAEVEAETYFDSKLDLDAVAKLELPLPLGSSKDAVSARSRAMAEAIKADASASGAKKVHVVAGWRHAHEIAWSLSRPQSHIS